MPLNRYCTSMRTSVRMRLPAGGVALLGLMFGAFVAPHLRAQTSVTYPLGATPQSVVSDGTNIWVGNVNGTLTKLLASTGGLVGTYPIAKELEYPQSVIFDGTNIWVAGDDGTSNGTVTKLLASTGATVDVFTVAGANPNGGGIAFDGVNIWVTTGRSVIKLLASTGAVVGTYPVASSDYLAFDGINIWVVNNGTNNVTKLLASTGATVGVYPAGLNPGGIAFDGTNIWVTNTQSSNFNAPGTVTKLLASTGAIVGTYNAGIGPTDLVFDGVNIWVTNVFSNNVTELLASTGALVGTFPVGTNPNAIAFDGANIWVANTGSNSVTKISPAREAPYISPGGIVPLDSRTSAIQPGEWASVYGNNLASGTAGWSGNFPTSLGGTSVEVNGKAAYLSFVNPGQINFQAPNDTATGSVPVVVTTASGSATSTVTLGQFGPSFLLLDATHVAGIIPRSNGSGAYGGGTYDILGPTGNSLGYATVAAKAGDIVELYGTGFGPTNPAVPAGQAYSGAAPTTNPVLVLIENGFTITPQIDFAAEGAITPSFAGLSSAGLYQLNLTIPVGTQNNPLPIGEIPIAAKVGTVITQSGVVISIQ